MTIVDEITKALRAGPLTAEELQRKVGSDVHLTNALIAIEDAGKAYYDRISKKWMLLQKRKK